MRKVKYIIVKNQFNIGTLTFWRSNQCGYTSNLEDAGIYDGTERKEYPIITKGNIELINKITLEQYPDEFDEEEIITIKKPTIKHYYIALRDLHLIGVKETYVNKLV